MKEPIRKDNERRLAKLEQELVSAANGPKRAVSISDLQNKRLIEVLREKVRKQGKTTK